MKALAAAALALALQADAVDLRWKLEKGQQLRYKTTHKSLAEGGGVFLEKEMAVTYLHSVTDVDAEGTATLRCAYEGIAAWSKGLQEYRYDSEKDKASPKDPGVRMLSRLVGQSFTVKMSPSGRVVEVLGFDKILEAIVKDAPDEDAGRRALQQVFSNESTKSLMQQIYLPLPGKKVSPGDSWSNELALQMPGVMGEAKLATQSRLAAVDRGEARIDQEMKLELKEGSPLKLSRFKGKAQGVFSLGRGRLASSKSEISVTLSSGAREMDVNTVNEVRLLSD